MDRDQEINKRHQQFTQKDRITAIFKIWVLCNQQTCAVIKRPRAIFHLHKSNMRVKFCTLQRTKQYRYKLCVKASFVKKNTTVS